MSVIRPDSERVYAEELYTCSFCSEKVDKGAVWVGPNLSICNWCILSNKAADIVGRIFGDALFAVHGGRTYKAEVDRVTKQIETSIYRILYNHTRASKAVKS
jgi:uncharacterized protein CbrC (UPF0167 family)